MNKYLEEIDVNIIIFALSLGKPDLLMYSHLKNVQLKSVSFKASLILPIHYRHENIICSCYGLIFPTESGKEVGENAFGIDAGICHI
jgi:hypothetical protein